MCVPAVFSMVSSQHTQTRPVPSTHCQFITTIWILFLCLPSSSVCHTAQLNESLAYDVLQHRHGNWLPRGIYLACSFPRCVCVMLQYSARARILTHIVCSSQSWHISSPPHSFVPWPTSSRAAEEERNVLFAHSAMSILKGTLGAELTISVSAKTDVSNLLLHQHDQNKSIEYLDDHHHELKHPLRTC